MIAAQTFTSFRRTQWRMLLATCFCYFFFYLGRQTFGFAVPGIAAEFGFTKQQIGWISAMMLWGYSIGQAINGNLGDKFGGRRAMTAGAILSCAANWCVSVGTGFWTLCLPWGANGYFQALGWAPGARLLSNWWGNHERGRVYGFYVFSSGAAAVLAYVSSIVVIDILHLDWRWIFRLPVLLMALVGILYFLTVRDTPEELGYPSPHRDCNAVVASVSETVDTESSIQRYKAVLSNWRISVAGLTIGFANAARYGLIVWVPVHFMGSAGGAAGAGLRWVSVALPCGMAIGAVANGWVSDRLFGSHRGNAIALFMVMAFATSMTMYLMPPSNIGVMIVALFLCGFFVYGPYTSLYALCPELVGVKRAGTATGILNFYSYLLAGLMEPMIGSVIDRSDTTSVVFLIVATSCAISFLISLLIRR